MVDRVIKEEMVFPFEFISPVEYAVEESAAQRAGVAIISGTLLREGVSRNGNVYTIDEMENIAKQVIGTPIYYGVMKKRDPNTGLMMKDKHANIEENRIGKIIDCVFNKTKRIIKFMAEIVNTESHPHIIEEVKQGWGISIGGIATKAKLVVDEAMRILTKIIGLELNHVQLLPPDKPTGVEGCQVENVEVQESMTIFCDELTGICYDSCGMPMSIKLKSESEETIRVNLGPIKKIRVQ